MISTHILDVSRGKPAAHVRIRLARKDATVWSEVGTDVTNADGRAREFVPPDTTLDPGTYRLTFETGAYFEDRAIASFYPYVEVIFDIRDPVEHYHVPLLLSPFGYSTYRGS